MGALSDHLAWTLSIISGHKRGSQNIKRDYDYTNGHCVIVWLGDDTTLVTELLYTGVRVTIHGVLRDGRSMVHRYCRALTLLLH